MLRWGILGTSFISDVVGRAIVGSPNSQIKAIFGRDATRLEAFADKFEVKSRYQSIQELIDDPEVDVIYVGLPSHMHAEAVIAAAKRGKPILSEKSLATTVHDAKDMIDAVRAANVFFVEGFMYLSHPFMTKLVETLRSGVLGNIRGVSGYYAANIWKKANPLGMGTIYNLGCYPVSLLHLVLQTAVGPNAFKTRQVCGLGNLSTQGAVHVRDASLTVRFDSGILATLQSTDSFGNDFGFSIQGDKGVLRFKTNPWLPAAGENSFEVRTYGGATETITISGEWDAFGYQVRMVEECITAGVKEAPRPSPTWDDSIEIMHLLTEWETDIKRRYKQGSE